MTQFNDPRRVIEDALRLEEAIKLVKAVDIESVNEHATGDYKGDKIATEGLFWGTIQQLKNWHRVAHGKAKRIL